MRRRRGTARSTAWRSTADSARRRRRGLSRPRPRMPRRPAIPARQGGGGTTPRRPRTSRTRVRRRPCSLRPDNCRNTSTAARWRRPPHASPCTCGREAREPARREESPPRVNSRPESSHQARRRPPALRGPRRKSPWTGRHTKASSLRRDATPQAVRFRRRIRSCRRRQHLSACAAPLRIPIRRARPQAADGRTSLCTAPATQPRGFRRLPPSRPPRGAARARADRTPRSGRTGFRPSRDRLRKGKSSGARRSRSSKDLRAPEPGRTGRAPIPLCSEAPPGATGT